MKVFLAQRRRLAKDSRGILVLAVMLARETKLLPKASINRENKAS